ncbi:methyltransferase domain-containing protein [Herbaspirillum sp. ST 5-3]|uniref:methyltransferase domain-containing protein n=1 Tax=Oxalobacteraceae TaxID=75682 RepID=UPI0010A3A2B1|nr:methyltransferase domain-containing protein [Herbaspirillum sp. ST 5-3]
MLDLPSSCGVTTHVYPLLGLLFLIAVASLSCYLAKVNMGASQCQFESGRWRIEPMSCCSHCVDAESLFTQRIAQRDLLRYRKYGPRFSTRLLLRVIGPPGTHAKTLLDIGGGIGAIPHELLASGLTSAVLVEASVAYLHVAEEEANRRGHRKRLICHHGDFVELASELAPADIVTLDRVICCYPDMETLVDASIAKAKHVYALVYPRERWITKIGAGLVNVFLRLRGGAFRTYIHSSKAVDAVIRRHGFRRSFYERTVLWQVVTYVRSDAP